MCFTKGNRIECSLLGVRPDKARCAVDCVQSDRGFKLDLKLKENTCDTVKKTINYKKPNETLTISWTKILNSKN